MQQLIEAQLLLADWYASGETMDNSTFNKIYDAINNKIKESENEPIS